MAEATNFKNNKTGQQIDLVDQNARDQITELNETLTEAETLLNNTLRRFSLTSQTSFIPFFEAAFEKGGYLSSFNFQNSEVIGGLSSSYYTGWCISRNAYLSKNQYIAACIFMINQSNNTIYFGYCKNMPAEGEEPDITWSTLNTTAL